MTEPVLTGVGEVLAEARQAQGLSVGDVSQQLKFMPRQIEALEAEHFQALPGSGVVRGMVRSYARLLKLDPAPLLARLPAGLQAPDPTPQIAERFTQPVPFSDSGRRSTLLYLGLSVGVVALAAVLAYQWRDERAVPQLVAAAQALGVLTGESSTTPPTPLAQNTETMSLNPVVTPEAPQASPAPETPRVSPPPVPAPPAAPASVSESKSTGPDQLLLKFDKEAWIEITDGAGRVLISSLNSAGTERIIDGRAPFNLVIGNAQHVRVSYNGRAVDLQPHVKVEVARLTLK